MIALTRCNLFLLPKYIIETSEVRDQVAPNFLRAKFADFLNTNIKLKFIWIMVEGAQNSNSIHCLQQSHQKGSDQVNIIQVPLKVNIL